MLGALRFSLSFFLSHLAAWLLYSLNVDFNSEGHRVEGDIFSLNNRVTAEPGFGGNPVYTPGPTCAVPRLGPTSSSTPLRALNPSAQAPEKGSEVLLLTQTYAAASHHFFICPVIASRALMMQKVPLCCLSSGPSWVLSDTFTIMFTSQLKRGKRGCHPPNIHPWLRFAQAGTIASRSCHRERNSGRTRGMRCRAAWSVRGGEGSPGSHSKRGI